MAAILFLEIYTGNRAKRKNKESAIPTDINGLLVA
jgi:hypothetical protein